MTQSPELGAALAAAHEAAGGVPFKDVRQAVYAQIGAYTPTEQTIRVWHTAKAPAMPDPVVLAALANFYGVEVSTLHPGGPSLIAAVKETLARSRCFATTLDLTCADAA